MTAVLVVQSLALVLSVVLIAGLLRSHAEILRRLHRLEAGSDGGIAAPVDFRVAPGTPGPPVNRPGFTAVADVSGSGLDDAAVSISVDGVAHRTLLAFLSSKCTTCAPFWSGARDLELPPDVRLVIVAKDADSESAAGLASLASPGTAVVMSTQTWQDYDVPASPYFVLVDGPRRRVAGEGTGLSWEQITRMLDEADEADESGDHASGRSQDRATRVDRELLAAGIRPGHASLYPDPGAPE